MKWKSSRSLFGNIEINPNAWNAERTRLAESKKGVCMLSLDRVVSELRETRDVILAASKTIDRPQTNTRGNDCSTALGIVTDLNETYATCLKAVGEEAVRQSSAVVNLELWLLHLLHSTVPINLEMLLQRLEDLYVLFGYAAFESHPGCLNEKLEVCAKDFALVYISWGHFPILRTFLQPMDAFFVNDLLNVVRTWRTTKSRTSPFQASKSSIVLKLNTGKWNEARITFPGNMELLSDLVEDISGLYSGGWHGQGLEAH